MAYNRERCRFCGKPRTPRRYLSGTAVCRACAVKRAADAAGVSFDLAADLAALPTRAEQGTLEAGIERSVVYAIARTKLAEDRMRRI